MRTNSPVAIAVSCGLILAIAFGYYEIFHKENKSYEQSDASILLILHELCLAQEEFKKLCIQDKDCDGVGGFAETLSQLTQLHEGYESQTPILRNLGERVDENTFLMSGYYYKSFSVEASESVENETWCIGAWPKQRGEDKARKCWIIMSDGLVYKFMNNDWKYEGLERALEPKHLLVSDNGKFLVRKGQGDWKLEASIRNEVLHRK